MGTANRNVRFRRDQRFMKQWRCHRWSGKRFCAHQRFQSLGRRGSSQWPTRSRENNHGDVWSRHVHERSVAVASCSGMICSWTNSHC